MKPSGHGLLAWVVMAGLAVLTSAAVIAPDSLRHNPEPIPTPAAITTLTSTSPAISMATSGNGMDDFSAAKILFPVPLPNWNMGITIQMPATIRGEYRAVVGETLKEYTCAPETDYQRPNWLFCHGRLPGVDKRVPFRLIDTATGWQVFSHEIYIPLDILYSEIL